jgi:hypothetical protein
MISIDVDATDCTRHAHMSVADYLTFSVRYMEETLGKDAAQRFPQVLAAMIQASAVEFQSAAIVSAAQRLAMAVECLQDDAHGDRHL